MNTKNANMKTEKVCTVCGGEAKPISEFRIHKTGYVLNQCKDCERAAATA